MLAFRAVVAIGAFLLVSTTVTPATAYPNGAPAGAVCDSLIPNHGVAGSSLPSPYSLAVSSTVYTSGSEVSVTINGPSYKGFLLEARKADGSNTTAVGTFKNAPDGAKTIGCFSTPDSAVTHSNPNDKGNLTIAWVAPKDNLGTLVFTASVVQNKTTFWVKLWSNEISFKADNGGSLTGRAALPLLLLAATAARFSMANM